MEVKMSKFNLFTRKNSAWPPVW